MVDIPRKQSQLTPQKNKTKPKLCYLQGLAELKARSPHQRLHSAQDLSPKIDENKKVTPDGMATKAAKMDTGKAKSEHQKN